MVSRWKVDHLRDGIGSPPLLLLDAAFGDYSGFRGEAKVLTLAFDRSVRQPRFSSDGSSIYFIADDDGTQNLCRIAVSGGEITRVIGGRLAVGAFSIGKEDAIAAEISTSDRPPEIFGQHGGDLTRLTQTNDALISQLRLAKVEYVHFKSKDGTSVAGYLYSP